MEPIQQGTPQWFDLKRGKIGATHMADILMKPTMAGYRNCLVKLALERMTGRTEETFCSFDMKNGIEMEPAARSCYEFETGNTVEEIAWVDHPTIPMAGCSPDGIVMNGGVIQGLAEFKCPKAATHLGYLLTEQIDRDYILQMQWQMSTTGAPWVDFESYQPAFPEHLQLKIIRVARDDAQIKILEDAAVLFNRAVEQVIADLNAT